MLKAGDVVKVRSGGPNMTIADCDEINARCYWFDEKKEQRSGTFPVAVLIIPPPRQSMSVGSFRR